MAAQPAASIPKERSPARFIVRCLFCLPLIAHVLWASAALWIDGPFDGWRGATFVGLFLLIALVLARFVRPFIRSYTLVFLAALAVSVWWLTLSPSNDRLWQNDVARLPVATLTGSMLRIQNVRRFVYGRDGRVEERWSTQTYDLDQLTGFDIFFSFWGPRAYGHTLASWAFADGRHLAISIETRKESHEEYSAIKGFFRQFELYYVVSEESDLVGVRAAHRDEQVELYRIYTPNEGDRLMLLDYIEDLNDLARVPRWYNALTDNCTTTMWRHARSIGSSFPLDWRLLANGYVLELAHELGTVNNSMAVSQLRARSNVTSRAKALSLAGVDDRTFSAGIRQDLPARPAP